MASIHERFLRSHGEFGHSFVGVLADPPVNPLAWQAPSLFARQLLMDPGSAPGHGNAYPWKPCSDFLFKSLKRQLFKPPQAFTW